MAYVIADRIKETTTTAGTGPFALAGAAAGYRAFSAVCANGDTAEVCVDDGAGSWIVALCTYASAGNTLAVSTIRSSSNGGAAVSFPAGAKNVYLTVPAARTYNPAAVAVTGGSIDGAAIGQTAQATGSFTELYAGYLQLGGNAVSAPVSVAINGTVSSGRCFEFYTAGGLRWQVGTGGGGNTEPGSNAGTNLFIARYSDAGAYLDLPLAIARATGVVSLTQAPSYPTPAAGDNSTNGATTAFVTNAVEGFATVAVAATGTTTLTAGQAGTAVIKLTGALTANVSVVVPAGAGRWTVWNATSGAFTATVKYASGTGVAVAQGTNATVFGDGTNVYVADTDMSGFAINVSSGAINGASVGATTPSSGKFTTLQATGYTGRGVQAGATAAGANQGAALAVTAPVVEVTTTASGTGVVLPAGLAAGTEILVFNAGANALAVYPPSGSSINALANNAAFSIAAAGSARFTATTSTKWRTG